MKNIILTGFMGTGKTEVGRELSNMLGWKLIDVDDEIVKSKKMSINDLFSQLGEPVFRDIEADMIRSVAANKNTIISTGGGAVLRQENMDALRENGIIVHLTATPETILKRTGISDERPLLRAENPLEKIKELLDFRKPFYEGADIVIETEDRTPRQIAGDIIERIKWQK